MKRGRQDHLDNLERSALRADLCAGFKTQFLTRKYNLSERVVQNYRAVLVAQGLIDRPLRDYAPPPPRDEGKRLDGPLGPRIWHLCFVSGCDKHVTHSNFCEAHEYRAPPNVERLTRGRA